MAECVPRGSTELAALVESKRMPPRKDPNKKAEAPAPVVAGKASAGGISLGGLFALVAIMAVVGRQLAAPRASIPPHLSNHPVHVIPELIPADLAAELMQIMKNFEVFSSNVDQSKAQGFAPKYEDIGEAEQIRPDGTCAHMLLFPNHNKSRCHLPQRVDIGKHFIMTGGMDGLKEPYSSLVDRVSSFGRYTFPEQLTDYPAVERLFGSSRFQAAARSVCPATKQHLDAFQFNYIVQVPGQTVALHIDSPYFYGADRFSFPQWLLVAMVWSGLFQDKFIDQVQVVGYLHEWEPAAAADGGPSGGGEFLWYDNSTSYHKVLPAPRSGSVVDGSKMLHAATAYRPSTRAPHMDKSRDNVLRFTGGASGEQWEVQSDGATIQQYNTTDLRIAIVYRARCFPDAEALEAYKSSPPEVMDMDAVLDKMVADLVVRGAMPAGSTKDTLPRLDLAFKLMDTYIRYPLPPTEMAILPYNLCAAPLVLPWLAPLFKSLPFCQ